MKLKRLKVQNFRNLKDFEMTPNPGINIIYGDNAQGKTNLVEAIWMFTGGKSFRGSKDKQQIKFNTEYYRNEIEFTQNDRLQTASIAVGDKKIVSLNDVNLSSSAGLIGKFACVIFSPNHLSIVKDGPAARRLFLDTAICQSKPAYVGLLHNYKKIMLQKNMVLKDIRISADLIDMLDIYDMQLAQLCFKIKEYRYGFLNDLAPVCSDIYSGLSSGKENFAVFLESSFTKEDTPESIYAKLKAARTEDIKNTHCTIGIHRDDLIFQINGLDARAYGSQGQQRSVALALKLSEGQLMKKYLGETPIMLLDDVMSELDESRQDYILNKLGEEQVFITCCDHSQISRLVKGTIYHMNDGVLEECIFI
ncbi:MAG: DNA replication/repair protein RecF [Oscillospiraceae bacterium]|nr:DNA replication/repair protein RecF [Oscillospiraceae bacterium]